MANRYVVACTDCPFTGRYASQAKADYAFGRHSCERHQQRAAETARYIKRHAAIDRNPKPCAHKEADHEHGTYACYVLDLCRCLPCASANNNYESERTRQQAYGRWNGLVDAGPAREHVRELKAQGMGLKRIAAVGGLSQGQLHKLMYGKRRADGSRTPSKRITPRVEEKILSVQLDLANGAVVDSTGAVRRIQALVALGWSQSKIAARLGIQRSNFGDLAHGRAGITFGYDQLVRALYDEWSMTLPPGTSHRDKQSASRARKYALAYGWEPPLAWDDDTIDDRAAAPYVTTDDDEIYLDQSAIARRLAGDRSVSLTRPEQAALVGLLLAAGLTKKDIERRTGVNSYRALATAEGVSA